MSMNIMCCVLLAIIVIKTTGKTIGNISKRELNWNVQNRNIESKQNTAPSIRVDNLTPYSKNDVDFNAKQTYMAFTLYQRNKNTGFFYFVSLAKVEKIKECGEDATNHAKAFYHFFNKCPEDANNLIASGWCYKGGNTQQLAFRSGTFNMEGSDYLDNQYYLDGLDREAHSYESKVLSQCFQKWRNSKFQVNLWSCSLQSLSTKSAVNICSDCTCDASLSDFSRLLTLLMVMISLLVV